MLDSKTILGALAISLGSLVFGAWGAWSIQTVRLNHAVDKIKLTNATLARQATEAALDRYKTLERTKDEAIQAHAELAAKNARSAASARATSDGLRRDLARVPARIAAASRAAVDEFATVSGELLGSCTAEYQRMAQEAATNAGHARLMFDAWPRERAE